MDQLPLHDPRRAALERLTQSRARLGQALAPADRGPSSGAATWRYLRRLGRRLLLGSGWAEAGALAGERLTPWAKRNPGLAVGAALVAGAGLFLARGWLVAAAKLQALRWWQSSQALLLQPEVATALLQALRPAETDAGKTPD